MALPMDEQRILEQMERMLAADDPRLAARLAAFGQPGLGQVLRTRRARATLSLMVLVLIAAVAAVIYMMSAFRAGGAAPGPRSHHVTQSAVPPAAPRINPARCTATLTPSCETWSQAATKPTARHPHAPARRLAR